MDEFLEKLAEDQRRMRDYFASQAARFKKMGATLAGTRERPGRIFVIGEPPMDRIAYLLAVEYLTGLPAVLLDHGEDAKADASEDDPAVASLARHFKKADVLVVLAANGQSATVKALFGLAKKKGTHSMLVCGLDAREHLRALADSAVSLPTRGLRTVCEASFLVARILSRCARSVLREKSGSDEEVKLVRIDCEHCGHPIFFEEAKKGKKLPCPYCKETVRVTAADRIVPRSDVSGVIPLPKNARTTKIRKKRLEEREEEKADEPEEEDEEDEKEEKAEKPEKKPAKPPIKQSVLAVPVVEVDEMTDESPPEAGISIDPDDPPPPRKTKKPDEESSVVAEVAKPAPPSETIIAPEDLAFDEIAGSSAKTPDPFPLPGAFVADLVMPQAKPSSAGKTPSDENPATSGEALTASSEDGSGVPKRLVSARFTVQDCRLKWGQGAFPDAAGKGTDHPLDKLSADGAVFHTGADDGASATLEEGDDLWVTLVVPAFLEPVKAVGKIEKLGGGGPGKKGTRVELAWKDLDAQVARKLARAAETLGLTAER